MSRAGDPVGPPAALTLSIVATVVALAGCSGAADADDRGVAPATTTATSESRVIQPGRPGESADVIEPGEPFELTDPGYNETDVRFVEQMIPHHRQALEMSELAPDRAADERVLRLAERIVAAQTPEIMAFEGWLEQRGLPVPPAATTNADLPGMVSPFQLHLLEDSSGREFDELFLTYMSDHHAGAVEMASTVIADGADTLAIEMATDVSVTQAAEINRMKDIQDDL